MQRRRILGVLSVLSVVSAMAACGDDAGTTPEGSSGGETSGTSTVSASASGTTGATNATSGTDTGLLDSSGDDDAEADSGSSTGEGPNLPPIANFDMLVSYQDPTTLSMAFPAGPVLSNDFDLEGGALQVQADAGLTVLGSSFEIDAEGAVEVTLQKGREGVLDEFAYVIEDNEGLTAESVVQFRLIAGQEIADSDAVILCPDGAEGCGHELADAGDVNGDGIADLVVGWPGADADRGHAYIIYGNAVRPRTLSLTDIAEGTGGVRIEGVDDDMGFGRDVAGVGDVNGDGFDDVAVLDFDAYVIYGGDALQPASVTALTSAGAAIEITRNTPFGDYYLDVDGLGGDVDGDGLDDFVLGTATNDDDGSHAHAYVVRGFAGGGTISQASLASGARGWWVRDDLELEGVGSGIEVAVRGLGDVNGDDVADFALVRSPARNGTPGGYVVFGRADANPLLASGMVEGTDGVYLQAGEAISRLESLAVVPEFGGAGVPGLAVGEGGFDSNDGRVVVLTDFDAHADLETDGVRLNGSTCRAGIDLGAAGDVNGDGRGDVLVHQTCAPSGQPAGPRTHVVYASDDDVSLNDTIRGTVGKVIDHPDSRVDDDYGAAGTQRFARLDFDGDGLDDTVVADPRRGVVLVLWGE